MTVAVEAVRGLGNEGCIETLAGLEGAFSGNGSHRHAEATELDSSGGREGDVTDEFGGGVQLFRGSTQPCGWTTRIRLKWWDLRESCNPVRVHRSPFKLIVHELKRTCPSPLPLRTAIPSKRALYHSTSEKLRVVNTITVDMPLSPANRLPASC